MNTVRFIGVVLAGALLAALPSAMAGTDTIARTYDFDDLTAGQPLEGQGGWVKYAGATEVADVVAATIGGISPNNVSGNVLLGGKDGTADAQYYRQNDTNYNYTLSAAGLVVVEFQTKFAAWGSEVVALGCFADGFQNDRVGPYFGVSKDDGFLVRKANFGSITGASTTTTTTGGAWTSSHLLKVRVTLDPTANGGDGYVDLEVTNLTLDDGVWVTKISDAPAGLTAMEAGYQTPDAWDGLYIRLSGTAADPGLIDNITVYGMAQYYDFDFLDSDTYQNGGEDLDGQDNWDKRAGVAANKIAATTAVTGGLAPDVGEGNVARGYTGDSQYTRANDDNWSFSLAGDKTVVIEFDGRYIGSINEVVALGYTETGVAYPNGNIGPYFGMSGSSFVCREAAFGTTASSPMATTTTGGEWSVAHLLRFRCTLNPRANAGDGSMTLEVTNLTLGDGEWVTKISGFNPGLASMTAGYQTTDTWNSLYMRMGADTIIDNIHIYEIPHRGTTVLIK
jgi:hypothetical protein